MTPATSGPEWRTPFAFYDPEASCWRTSQATFLSDSDLFSETWPRSGMTRAGFAYELPTPALPTVGPESSSLLPTPAVNDMGAAYTPDEWDAWTARMQEKHSNGNGHGKSLAIEAQRLLPTPTVGDSASARNSTATRHNPDSQHHSGMTLTDALVPLLPTPTASDTNGAGAHGTGGPDLRTAVALLPTPRATDGEKGGPNQQGSSGDLMLPSAVQQFLPTPTSRDWKGANQRGDSTCLHGAVTNPPSDAGSASSDDQLPGQLSLDAPESA
jgi:hypothetical protein